tara:strand:+ start:589 stop:1491 length:903 start_codon:yes stop_codon:yes gene_type:complete
MNKTISIIVPCYNSENTIFGTINAIKDSISDCTLDLRWEIIAINDGSTDNTKSILEKTENITLINHPSNQSLSSARNTGVKKSTGAYIAFIDADIKISKKWFLEMLTVLEKNLEVIGVTGTLVPWSEGQMSPLKKYLFSRYRGQQPVSKDSALNYKSFVFSNTIIRKTILDEVGVFDESLNHYGGEDTELAIRINSKFPNAMRKLKSKSVHLTNKSLQQYLNNMFDYGQHNFPKIIQKHPNYKNELGYKYVNSLLGKVIFNRLTVSCIKGLLNIIKHPLLIKFLVINSFICGARLGTKRP